MGLLDDWWGWRQGNASSLRDATRAGTDATMTALRGGLLDDAGREALLSSPGNWGGVGNVGGGLLMGGITKAAPDAARAVAEQLSARVAATYPGVELALSGGGRGLTLGKVVVPKDARGAGTGSAVMNDIIAAADEAGLPVALSPSSDFGGNVNRLRAFYKRFGFVENKGRNRDFEISESMFREPR